MVMIIHTKAHPRAGLIGNPSDGYFGKTISFTFSNFAADVMLWESPALEILPNERDHSRFQSIRHLTQDVKLFGYYGGIRLVKAAIKRFYEYSRSNRIELDDRNFTIRYNSTIPHQVGLAGSSAIIIASLRALMRFYGVSIPPPLLAGLALSVEVQELKIQAGLQDRVAQSYEGLVFMDFNREHLQKWGYGRYERLPLKALPPLYIAYKDELSESSDVSHNDIRARFDRGDAPVVDAMAYWAGLAQQMRDLLLAGRGEEIGPLLDANFDMRRKIFKLSEGNISMVETARSAGATAKFTGSGGAIIGTYRDEAMFDALVNALQPLKVKVIKPQFVPGDYP